MDTSRLIIAAFALLTTVGGLYYTATDKEAQGAVVVLVGIAWLLALPRLFKSE